MSLIGNEIPDCIKPSSIPWLRGRCAGVVWTRWSRNWWFGRGRRGRRGKMWGNGGTGWCRRHRRVRRKKVIMNNLQ
jgi:hypothetical protein